MNLIALSGVAAGKTISSEKPRRRGGVKTMLGRGRGGREEQ